MKSQKFKVAECEIGVLYVENNFVKLLVAGEYDFWIFDRNVNVKTLNQRSNPEAKIDNLELLIDTHERELQEHVLIVKTEFNQAALIRSDRNWYGMKPNQVNAYWRQSHDLESHLFNLEDTLELPANFVQKLRDESIPNIKKFEISQSQLGLLYIQDNFIRPLSAGEYAFWSVNRDIKVITLNLLIPNPTFPQEEFLIERHQDFVSEYCTAVQLLAHQVAIVRHLGKVIAILPPTSRKLFWQVVEVELIDITNDAKLPANLVSEFRASSPDVLLPNSQSIHTCEVPAQGERT